MINIVEVLIVIMMVMVFFYFICSIVWINGFLDVFFFFVIFGNCFWVLMNFKMGNFVVKWVI